MDAKILLRLSLLLSLWICHSHGSRFSYKKYHVKHCGFCEKKNAVCVRLWWFGYHCICLGGFTEVDGQCSDKDECSLKSSKCDLLVSDCRNTVGSYKCICHDGYHGDGINCTPLPSDAVPTATSSILESTSVVPSSMSSSIEASSMMTSIVESSMISSPHLEPSTMMTSPLEVSTSGFPDSSSFSEPVSSVISSMESSLPPLSSLDSSSVSSIEPSTSMTSMISSDLSTVTSIETSALTSVTSMVSSELISTLSSLESSDLSPAATDLSSLPAMDTSDLSSLVSMETSALPDVSSIESLDISSMASSESSAVPDSCMSSSASGSIDSSSQVSSLESSSSISPSAPIMPSASVEAEDVLQFVKEPREKVRVEGERAMLCCQATPTQPHQDIQYTWYKDGLAVEVKMPVFLPGLMLSDLTEEDAGYYHCVANTTDAMGQSLVARLHVNKPADVCQTTINSNLKLPPGCSPTMEDGEPFALSSCSRDTCTGKDWGSCRDQEVHCCQPIKYEKKSTLCLGNFQLQTIIPAICNCQRCSVSEFTLAGKVVSLDGLLPLKLGQILVNGEQMAFTDFHGNFQVQLKRGTTLLSFTFIDMVFEEFFESTHLIHVYSDTNMLETVFYVPRLVDGHVYTDSSYQTLAPGIDMLISFVPDLPIPKKVIYVLDQNLEGSYKLVPSDRTKYKGHLVPFHSLCMAAINYDPSITSFNINLNVSKEVVVELGGNVIPSLYFLGRDGVWYKNKCMVVEYDTYFLLNSTLETKPKWISLGLPSSELCYTKIRYGAEEYTQYLYLLQKPSHVVRLWTLVAHYVVDRIEETCIITSCEPISIRDETNQFTTHFQSIHIKLNDLLAVTMQEALTECKNKSLVTTTMLNEYTDITYLLETAFILFTLLPPADLLMAWYPLAYRNNYKACFIKCKVLCPGETKMHIFSFGGTHAVTKGRLYGTRSGPVGTNGTICLEYKCSGHLYTEGPDAKDTTLLELKLEGSPKCFMSAMTNDLFLKMRSDTPAVFQAFSPNSFSLYVPPETSGTGYGLYEVSSQLSSAHARKQAQHQCYTAHVHKDNSQLSNNDYSEYDLEGLALLFDEPTLNVGQIHTSIDKENV